MLQRVGLWRWVRNAALRHTDALQYQAYLDSLLLNLSDHPQVIGHESLLKDNINKLYKEALQRHAKIIVDDRARTHLQVACLVEGSYKTLLPWFRNDQDEVIELIRKPLGESAAGVLGIFQKMALFLSFDKFSFLSRSLNYLDSDFGKAFSIDHHINTRSHRASVKRCLYNSVFTADGVPELIPIFCALDRMWFDEVHPVRHGINFSRPSTLADGATACEFIIRRSATKTAANFLNGDKN